MKRMLIRKVIAHLQEELSVLLQAAENAHLAAIDEQSIAETQYDTLAIEASYLAEGQSKRVLALRQGIALFQKLTFTKSYKTVTVGTLVQLSKDEDANHWFFIAPAAAGYKVQIEQRMITLVTPNSPMGKALLNKELDDDFELKIKNQILIDSIAKIE